MTFVAAVLIASLLGSVHCAAMCGAFVCSYAAQPRTTRGGRVHAAYHAGRLASYTLLGAIAGAIGGDADRIGALAGVSRGAAILGGSLMVLWAGSNIAATLGMRALVSWPEWMMRALGGVLARVPAQSAVARAGATGLLTTLLPCGWLYAFVATSAGTGSAVTGAATMGLFWIGTVPMLLAVGLGAQRLFGAFGRRLPVVSAVVVLTMGLLSIAGKMQAPGEATASHTEMRHAR